MDKLGIYLSVSLYFVVGTLVEFALVLFLKIYYEQKKSKIKKIKSDGIYPLSLVSKNKEDSRKRILSQMHRFST